VTKILFLAANPTNTTRLALDLEVKEITTKLRMAPYGHQFEIATEWAVRADEIQAALLRHKPEIVHFSGHGQGSAAVPGGRDIVPMAGLATNAGILVEDHARNPVPIRGDALAETFRIVGGVDVVVLNACHSASQSEAILQHVNIVVGMGQAIQDASAIQFAASFYQSLAFGQPIQAAFELGKNQISLMNFQDADVPKLQKRNAVDPAKRYFVNYAPGVAQPSALLLVPINQDVREIGRVLEIFIRPLDVDPGEARAIYDECLQLNSAPSLPFDPQCPLLAVLDALVRNAQLEPLLRLADRVARHQNDQARMVLEKRLESVVPNWRTRFSPVQSQRAVKSTLQDADNYAIIQFTPSAQTPDMYMAYGWLVLDGKRIRDPLLHEDGVSEAGIPEAICRIHQAINSRRKTVRREQICLEIFLPDHLFLRALDQCPVDVPGQPDRIPIGYLYPIVLRWNDRAVHPQLRGELGDTRFQLLMTHGKHEASIPHYDPDAELGPCAWMDPDRWPARDVHVSVSRKNGLVLCLLTSPPSGDLSRCALRGLLTGGVPAVLWSSKDGDASREQLAELVTERPISKLRHYVFDVRTAQQHPLREHLSLLWENPNRMPPRPQRFRVPGKRGTT